MPAIGIDLGTTNSRVAVFDGKKVAVIQDKLHHRDTPSCVSFTKDARYIGKDALNQLKKNPSNTIYDVKRIIGRTPEDVQQMNLQENLPYVFENGMIQVRYKKESRSLYPEEISSMLLSTMVDIASREVQVEGAVITVSTSFNVAQRKATEDAAKIAGIEVLGLINETTAIALAYRQRSRKEFANRKILVLHIGGGTLDVAVITIDGYHFQVQSSVGNSCFGGSNFTARLSERVANHLNQTHANIAANRPITSSIYFACEKAKLDLSNKEKTSIKLDTFVKGKEIEEPITRGQFNQITKDFLQIINGTIRQALHEAKVDAKQIDDVLVAGGSTRIHVIQEMLSKDLGFEGRIRKSNMDEAAVEGAAIMASIYSSKRETYQQDFSTEETFSLSVLFDKTEIFQRGIKIPCIQDFPCTIPARNFDVILFNEERTVALQNSGIADQPVHQYVFQPHQRSEIGQITLHSSTKHSGTIRFALNESGVLVASVEHGQFQLHQNIGLPESKMESLKRQAKKYREEDLERKRELKELTSFERALENAIKWVRQDKIRTLQDISRKRKEFSGIGEAKEKGSQTIPEQPMTNKRRRTSEDDRESVENQTTGGVFHWVSNRFSSLTSAVQRTPPSQEKSDSSATNYKINVGKRASEIQLEQSRSVPDKSLRVAIEPAGEEIEKLKHIGDKQRQDIAEKDDEIRKLKKRSLDLETENSQILADGRKRDLELENAKGTLSSLKAENSQIAEDLRNSQAALSSLQKACAQQKELIAHKDDKITQLENMLSQMKEKSQENVLTEIQKRAELEKIYKQKEEMSQGDVESKKRIIREKDQLIKRLEKKNKKIQRKNEELKDDAVKAQDSYCQLLEKQGKEASEIESQKCYLEDQLTILTYQKNELSGRVEVLQRQTQEDVQNIEEKSQELEEEREKMRKTEEKCDRLKKVEDIKSINNHHIRLIVVVLLCIIPPANGHKYISQVSQAQRQRINILEAKELSQVSEIASLQSQCENLQDGLKRSEERIAISEAKRQTLVTEIDGMTTKISSQASDVDRLQSEKNELNQAVLKSIHMKKIDTPQSGKKGGGRRPERATSKKAEKITAEGKTPRKSVEQSTTAKKKSPSRSRSVLGNFCGLRRRKNKENSILDVEMKKSNKVIEKERNIPSKTLRQGIESSKRGTEQMEST